MNYPISIILPTYNREHSLLKSIESILCQTYTNFELIIVDDASTDHTEHVVKELQDERIRYHRLAKNSGASIARNQGVALARSEWIAFQDSDDIWRPEKLQKCADYLDTHSDVILLYSAYETTRDGRAYRVPPHNYPSSELSGSIHAHLLCRNTIGTPTMLLRRDRFLEVDGFDPDMPALEDWDLAIRISALGPIGYLNETLVRAAESIGGISSGTANYYDARIRMLIKYRDEIVQYGLFDEIVTDILTRAEKSGLLDLIKRMLMLQLAPA